MIDAASAKAVLRAAQLAARRARPAEQLAEARAGVVRAVLAALADHPVATVAAYEPLRTEPGSERLLAALAERGAVLVPRLLEDRDLSWSSWPDGADLGPDALARAGLILVPALAVDRSGVRLGRGGGSYDRALGRRSARAVVAALLFDGELTDALPADEWDVGVDAVVQPGGWTWLAPGDPREWGNARMPHHGWHS